MKEMATEGDHTTGTVDSTASLRTLLDSLFLHRRGVRAGSMFGHRAYFVGRRLFACITTRGVCLRLGRVRAERAVACGVATDFRPHGRPMRGWAEIESERVNRGLDVVKCFRHALAYARLLAREEGQ